MATPSQPFIGKGERDLYLLPRMSNRHGLIAGATGTGKTVAAAGGKTGFGLRR